MTGPELQASAYGVLAGCDLRIQTAEAKGLPPGHWTCGEWCVTITTCKDAYDWQPSTVPCPYCRKMMKQLVNAQSFGTARIVKSCDPSKGTCNAMYQRVPTTHIVVACGCCWKERDHKSFMTVPKEMLNEESTAPVSSDRPSLPG